MARHIRPHGVGIRGFELAAKSVLFESPWRMFRALPPAKFGADDNESRKVYLGQFTDHDLTFDPASSVQRQNGRDALLDFRTPRFGLDSVYGRGPDDQPYVYDGPRLFLLRIS